MSRLAPGLEKAVQLLGQGFISHPANTELRKRLKASPDAKDLYRQLIRVAYRIVFLLIAEDRDVLHPSDASTSSRRLYERSSSMRRLRALASSDIPTDSGSLWTQLGAVFNALAADGDQRLGLPALGGAFWSHASTPLLLAKAQAVHAIDKPVLISDRHILQAIRAIAFEDGEINDRRLIDFCSVGPGDLGSAYESLLTLSPHMNLGAREQESFTLYQAATHARKTSGSYYTPDPLVQRMLDAALEPTLHEATQGKDRHQAERAILELKICDPACGAGYFLIAAGKRLALRLAQVRTSEHQPPAEPLRLAMRDVMSRCIYGVDLDFMALDLCKINLWFEASEPGMRFSTLDHHIRPGNALVGATPELIAQGIPDSAFIPLPGDDPVAVAQFRSRNRRERKLLGSPAGANSPIATKSVEHARLLADAWCAAFVCRKPVFGTPASGRAARSAPDAITHQVLRDIGNNSRSRDLPILQEAARLARAYGFFHWHLEFPEVFSSPRTGFDVILGNPPFLNQLESATVTARGADAIIRLRSGSVVRSYTDLSATFLLIATRLTAEGGRVALVQPQSLLAVKDAAPIRRSVLERASLEALWVSNEHVFEDAGIYTCAPTLHVGGPRRSKLTRLVGGSFTELPAMDIDNDVLANDETWAHLTASASGIPEVRVPGERTLADIADATADFRDQYYGLDGFLIEDAALTSKQRADWEHFPFVLTSGLIDLCRSHWGTTPTRILKKHWTAPRLDRSRMEAQGSLGLWIASRLVPKVLVAAQTRVIEVLTDAEGRFLPSVPLITVTPKNSADLWRIASAIASPACTAIAMQRYAGAAMNADAIKLSARQTLRMPLPVHLELWDLAARDLQAAGTSTTPEGRTAALRQFAARSCESYALPPQQAQTLARWWLERLERRPRRRGAQAASPSVAPRPAFATTAEEVSGGHPGA